MKISFQGRPDPLDLLKIFKLSSMNYSWVNPFFTCLGVLFLAFSSVSVWKGALNLLGIIFGIIYLIAAATQFWLPYFIASKLLGPLQELERTISGTISENALTLQAGEDCTTIHWSLYRRVKRLDDLILLYQEGSTYNYFLSSFFASENEWLAFAHLVDRKVKDGGLVDPLDKPFYLLAGSSLAQRQLFLAISLYALPALMTLIGYAAVEILLIPAR